MSQSSRVPVLRAACAGFAAAILAGPGGAPIAGQQPSFSARVDNVRVDVEVRRDDKLVSGLTAADFEVLGGRPGAVGDLAQRQMYRLGAGMARRGALERRACLGEVSEPRLGAARHPKAQSPQVALTHVALIEGRTSDGSETAVQAMGRRWREEVTDPWHVYFRLHEPTAQAQLAALRASVR